MHFPALRLRSNHALPLLMLACLALGGCSSVGTFWNFMRGEFMIDESEVQRRLGQRGAEGAR